MAEVDFRRCPRYTQDEEIEAKVETMYGVHREIIKELKTMGKLQKKQARYLTSHMKEEEIHHKAVNDTLVDLMKDKKIRDDVRDKRDGIKDKVYASLALAAIIGAYNFFMDMLAMRAALGVE